MKPATHTAQTSTHGAVADAHGPHVFEGLVTRHAFKTFYFCCWKSSVHDAAPWVSQLWCMQKQRQDGKNVKGKIQNDMSCCRRAPEDTEKHKKLARLNRMDVPNRVLKDLLSCSNAPIIWHHLWCVNVHTICLTVVKWHFKHNKEMFSLVGLIDQLDARLLAMMQPNKVERLPSSYIICVIECIVCSGPWPFDLSVVLSLFFIGHETSNPYCPRLYTRSCGRPTWTTCLWRTRHQTCI